MEPVSKEEREFLCELYGRDVSENEAEAMMRNLTDYFKRLNEAEPKVKGGLYGKQ